MRQTLLYIVSLIFTKFILTFYCENNGVGKACTIFLMDVEFCLKWESVNSTKFSLGASKRIYEYLESYKLRNMY